MGLLVNSLQGVGEKLGDIGISVTYHISKAYIDNYPSLRVSLLVELAATWWMFTKGLRNCGDPWKPQIMCNFGYSGL